MNYRTFLQRQDRCAGSRPQNPCCDFILYDEKAAKGLCSASICLQTSKQFVGQKFSARNKAWGSQNINALGLASGNDLYKNGQSVSSFNKFAERSSGTAGKKIQSGENNTLSQLSFQYKTMASD
jgi:hypothetical protein